MPKTYKLWINGAEIAGQLLALLVTFLDPAQKAPHHPLQHRLIGHYNIGTYLLMFSLNWMQFISKDFFRRPFSLGVVASPQPLLAPLPPPSPSFPPIPHFFFFIQTPSFHFANQPTVHNRGVCRGMVSGYGCWR